MIWFWVIGQAVAAGVRELIWAIANTEPTKVREAFRDHHKHKVAQRFRSNLGTK